MLKLNKSLYGQQVLSLRISRPIATTVRPIINPHNLKIIGWWCKPTDLKTEKVLLEKDVREVSSKGLIVNDHDVLSSAADLARHQEILEINFSLIDKLVRTKRRKLGKISDYAYDESMFIQKLYVDRPITKLFSNDGTLIIGRNQIVEVSDRQIVVRDTEITESETELAAEGAVG